MTITLPADDQKLLSELLAGGEFATPEAAMHEALRLLHDRKTLERKLEEGLDDLANGRVTVMNNADELAAHFARLRAEAERPLNESELRRKIQEGIDSLEQGEAIEVTTKEQQDRYLADISARAARKLR